MPFALSFKEYNRREATVMSELHSPAIGETLLHQLTCLPSWEKILSGFVLLSTEHLQTQGTGGFRLHRLCFLHPFLTLNHQQSTNYINYRQVYCWLTSVVPVPPPRPCASCHHEGCTCIWERGTATDGCSEVKTRKSIGNCKLWKNDEEVTSFEYLLPLFLI